MTKLVIAVLICCVFVLVSSVYIDPFGNRHHKTHDGRRFVCVLYKLDGIVSGFWPNTCYYFNSISVSFKHFGDQLPLETIFLCTIYKMILHLTSSKIIYMFFQILSEYSISQILRIPQMTYFEEHLD